MTKQHDIEINVMHTLENFRDAYDNESYVWYWRRWLTPWMPRPIAST